MKIHWPMVVLMLGLALTGRTQTRPAEPVVWKVDNLKVIAPGHPVEVIGSPQIVKDSTASAIRFNGAADGLMIPANPVEGLREFTVEMLIKPDMGGPLEQRFLHFQDDQETRGLMELRMYENGWAFDAFLRSATGQRALFDQKLLHPAGQWTWVAMTFRDGTLSSFINGKKELEGPVPFPAMGPGRTSIGVRQNRVSWFKGEIREVRFHPTALPAEKLQRVAQP